MQDKLKQNLTYYVAAFTLPSVFLYFLFSANTAGNDLSFRWTFVLSLFLGFVAVGVFWLLTLITHSKQASLVVFTLLQIFFWMFETLYLLFSSQREHFSRSIFGGLTLLGIVLIAVCLRYYKAYIEKWLWVKFVTLAITGLFLWNFIVVAHDQFILLTATTGDELFDWNINVDSRLPNPDIFWLHIDGMMNFETLANYFDSPQADVMHDLEKLGFVINENAVLVAGTTDIALPVLFSPHFYDDFFSYYVDGISHLMHARRQEEIRDNLAAHGLTFFGDVYPHMELFRAFEEVGYTRVMLAGNVSLGGSVRPRSMPVDLLYRGNDDTYPLLIGMSESAFLDEIEDLLLLLMLATPLSLFSERIVGMFEGNQDEDWLIIPEHAEIVERFIQYSPYTEIREWDRRLYRNMADVVMLPSPKLVFVEINYTHLAYWYLLGAYNPTGLNNAVEYLYYPNHRHAMLVALNLIEIILENNPDAVIVVQSDHGIHTNQAQRRLRELGYSDEQILYFNRSVMSAIRIPDTYGELDSPIEPRNITRELVNRFVGPNYTLLPN